ncbi:bacteriophage abortive infection AbiH family protein [Cellulophaga sp. F20128]|uniref:AbiH family protein n=1 Tax=Cellulophaga sp. F20128 TaxID=2926413 RepID=UPI001FF2C31B|nr:AbiH family protein [Cellulophaga sp. F20128]MCK0156166.1 bacteriophage abortive infection AbiH family protein [Cellulophaga sp. F20128]
MKIVYLLGNGFDVNLNLKTRYPDFYQYYNNIDSKSESISNLKKSIQNEESWADLESMLGEYTQDIKSTNEFIEIFEDIGDNLADYLKEEEKKIDLLKIEKDIFFEYLTFPERSLSEAQKNKVSKLRTKWKNHHWSTYVITFNYTNTFEKLIRAEEKSIQIGTHNGLPINYNGIQHIHGYIDNSMVMGVNDISQIKNQEFHNEPEILNAFVKSQCNQAMQHTIDDQCKQHILSANLICIYGSSLGKTDKIWWEIIGERLKDDCNLIIFEYTNQKLSQRRDYKRETIRDGIKKSFLEKTNLTKKEKEVAHSKIFVGINRDLFNIIKNETNK